MKRGQPQPYGGGEVNQNPYSQMQQLPNHSERMQPHSNYLGSGPGRAKEEHQHQHQHDGQYVPAKVEEHWQWDRDAQQMSPHLYRGDVSGEVGNAGRSFYPNQIPETKIGANQDSRVRPQEQDMAIGYEEKPAPQLLEGLEKKFRDDILKLTTEQIEAEDAENARHREKIVEINNQYQESLSALRARHSSRREEFLLKEAQARLQEYRRAGMTYHSNNRPSDVGLGHHGYGGAPGPVPGEPQRQGAGAPGGGQFDSYRQRSESFGQGRTQGADVRIPTPGGRAYNAGPRYY